MNLELTGMSELLAAMKDGLSDSPKLVTVDGVRGAGQKEVAAKIAAHFGCEVVDVDETADAAQFKTVIAAKCKKSPVVVAGILMRTLITAAGLTPDISIYVVPSPKSKQRSFWEGILSKPLEDYLAELTVPLDKKTVEYHWKYHPIINADFLVEGK
jgi:hypothetical protein